MALNERVETVIFIGLDASIVRNLDGRVVDARTVEPTYAAKVLSGLQPPKPLLTRLGEMRTAVISSLPRLSAHRLPPSPLL